MNEILRLQQMAGLRPVNMPQFTEVEEDTEVVSKTIVGGRSTDKKTIQQEMFKIGKYAIAIHKMIADLPDNTAFPAEWLAKVTKASTYISEAKHGLENDLQAPADDTDDE